MLTESAATRFDTREEATDLVIYLKRVSLNILITNFLQHIQITLKKQNLR